MEPLCVVTRTADLVEGVSTIGHYSIDKLSKFITGSPSSLAPQVRVGRFRLLAIAELDNYSTSIFGESEDNDKHYMKWMRSMAVRLLMVSMVTPAPAIAISGVYGVFDC
jgi:hypothetical protein